MNLFLLIYSFTKYTQYIFILEALKQHTAVPTEVVFRGKTQALGFY